MKSILFALLLALSVHAEGVPPQVIELWPEGAPGALGKEDKDIPTLTVYVANITTNMGAAMIVCPGGGYAHLAPHEGHDYALWLKEQGITAFVLKYRLASGGYHNPHMLEDAARAMRLVRSRAGDWNIDPKRIGIMGSSAGGHLASTLLTHWDSGKPDSADPIERASSRPDLGILCYPVITMKDPNVHSGSRKNLLGDAPTSELIAEFSNEEHVTKQTAPCFVWHTDEDNGVKVENSFAFAAALRKAGVPFEFHVYQRGPHGIGLGSKTYDPAQWHRWTSDCRVWLKEQKFGK